MEWHYIMVERAQNTCLKGIGGGSFLHSRSRDISDSPIKIEQFRFKHRLLYYMIKKIKYVFLDLIILIERLQISRMRECVSRESKSKLKVVKIKRKREFDLFKATICFVLKKGINQKKTRNMLMYEN